jgi:hypothetical protein
VTWKDFLKYAKWISVFYAIGFAMALLGIWLPELGAKFIWSGVLFAGAAGIANVALGSYHYNHKPEMSMQKNMYLAEQAEAQVITGDGVSVQPGQALRQLEAKLTVDLDQKVRREVRDQRGY